MPKVLSAIRKENYRQIDPASPECSAAKFHLLMQLV
jgi:hypothetical protein